MAYMCQQINSCWIKRRKKNQLRRRKKKKKVEQKLSRKKETKKVVLIGAKRIMLTMLRKDLSLKGHDFSIIDLVALRCEKRYFVFVSRN